MKVTKKIKASATTNAGVGKIKKLKSGGKIKVKDAEDGTKAAIKRKTKKVIAINGEKKVMKVVKKKSKKDESTKKVTKGKTSHREQLEGLKDIDPEFYDFLKKNDKALLEFNLYDDTDDDEEAAAAEKDQSEQKKSKKKERKSKKSKKGANESDDDDGDGDGDEEAEDESAGSDDEKFHKPTDRLEVASDESDFEDEEETAASGQQKVTFNLLRQWQTELEKPNVAIDVIRKVIQAFSSALASISPDENEKSLATYKVVGGAVFNGVVQLCVLHLRPALLRFMGITSKTTTPLHKMKKWPKLRSCLRHYLNDLVRLVEQVSSENILSVLLKHLHQMAPMVAPFTTLGKTILKRLIVLWSTSDETSRVLAFLCILKITRNQQISMLHHVLKAMYLSYVRNSKFVSPNTLPGINFMRRSLIEMFALDLNASYQHVFLYIRQLAIHLRNAVILKKKDSFKAVYNWQFVNSLKLWAELLGASANKPQLQPLVYPLVIIIIGIIRLIPTAQYFPLRFHCIQSLILLSKQTQTFVPVLPFLLEVLNSNTFNRKHTGVSMRPLQFTCILRLNKTQLSENGFRDEVIEQVCGLTLEYLAHTSASLAFSDLIVPAVIALKAYLKVCKNANYSRKIKQLLDKIQENGKFIEQERRKITFDLKDLAQVQAWETQVRNKGTPLDIYYTSWVKTHETKKRRLAAQSDKINGDYDVPSIKRKAKSGDVKIRNDEGEVELFPSDSEDDDLAIMGTDEDDEEVEAPKAKKSKKQKQDKSKKEKQPKPTAVDVPVEEDEDDEADESANNVDIVKDLDLDDW